jgi:hypothetical protein
VSGPQAREDRLAVSSSAVTDAPSRVGREFSPA